MSDLDRSICVLKNMKAEYRLIIIRSVPCTIHSVPCTIHSVPCTIRSVPCIIRSVPCTIRSVPCTIHSEPCTIRSVPCTIRSVLCTIMGTAVAQWLRYCATNRKVAGSIQDGFIGIFHWHKSFWSHYGLGVDSASNRNKYKENFLGVNAAGA
jgi:hypothetical protein